jgi:energy-coupling factor transporter ATP-binding protein EcfA2
VFFLFVQFEYVLASVFCLEDSIISEAIIQVDHLSFAYRTDQWIFRDISFLIEKGAICALVGPSGTGKTTLGYILKGLIPHSIRGNLDGDISVVGLDIKKSPLPVISKSVGMVFQDLNAQLFSMTVHEEIEFGLHNLKLPLEWAQEAMHFLQIDDLANDVPMNLSAGQKQRVILASIIAMHPKVLILDEPSAHLDFNAKQLLRDWLRQLNQEQHNTIILIDQDPWLIGELCNQFLFLNNKTINHQEKEDLMEQRPQWSWKW